MAPRTVHLHLGVRTRRGGGLGGGTRPRQRLLLGGSRRLELGFDRGAGFTAGLANRSELGLGGRADPVGLLARRVGLLGGAVAIVAERVELLRQLAARARFGRRRLA